MSMPFYVSPEQVMKDRADYARKGIARGALKKLYRDDVTEDDAVVACIQALYDAADDDSATGGPDLTRRIYPVIASVTGDGFRRLPDEVVEQVTQRVVDERMSQPGGPQAPLRGTTP